MSHFGKFLFLLIATVLFLAGCHSAPPQPINWQQAMQQKIAKYQDASEKELKPYFAQAKVNYPPEDLALLVFKNTKRLELWAKSTDHSPWAYIRSFSILAASGGPGPKLHEGDYQVPEGIYHIVGMNPQSHYDLSLQLNYPNDFDIAKAHQDDRDNLGGDVFVHGKDSSAGCVALGDKTIEQLFPLVYYVGSANVVVVIAPNDLRVGPPLKPKIKSAWLPELYKQLNQTLAEFKPAPDNPTPASESQK